jgi:hypothetical protein
MIPSVAVVMPNPRFPRVSEMKQNQANLAKCLSIIWRIELNTVKYCEISLNGVEDACLELSSRQPNSYSLGGN